MHTTNAGFTRADPVFYDHPRLVPATAGQRFAPAAECDWSEWDTADDDDWTAWHPHGRHLPEQGWKIHASTTLEGAAELLRLVSAYCHEHRLAFKHLRDRDVLTLRNAKDADREGSGKFVTIYPRDTPELEQTLTDLDAVVGGLPGPYVLTDLRWKDGPLYVRYGGFARLQTRDRDGRPILAVRHPDGALVEDLRTVGFEPPEWVDIPDFLRAQLTRLADDAAPSEFPYAVGWPLHYSNAGGVYAATTRSGEQVVLKEARPHAGLTPDGRDAVARLVDEEAALRALAGPDVVGVRESFELDGHRFLVLDHVAGTNLNTEIVARNPIVRATATTADYLDYRQWALDIAGQVETAVDRIHRGGYVHGDLHPGNVLVTRDDRVVLLDLEVARAIDDDSAAVLGTPGFVAPDRRHGVAADRYALACLKLAFFVPLTPLLCLDPLKADDLLDAARTTYALDEAWLDAIHRDLALPGRELLASRSRLVREADDTVRSWDTETEDALVGLEVMIGRSLSAGADFSRADRAWPGDPVQFDEGAFGLAHGAAGIIHTIDACRLDLDPQALDWLDAAVLAAGAPRPSATERIGLYDGVAGVGWLYRRYGDDKRADALLARVRDADLERLGPDLYGGLAGVGLYLLSESDRDPGLLTTAHQIARMLRERHERRPAIDFADPEPAVATGRGGLMWGSSGTALFALRLYQRTGEPAHLRLATDALDYDLAHCIEAVDGSLQMNEGWRLMPYLATGSAGVGLVAAQLIPVLDDPDPYLAALDGIRLAACTPFVIEPSLFYGRAGLIHFLVTLTRCGLSTPQADAALRAHVNALRLHAIRHRTGIGFPGEGLLRLSCDLATGSAGVLGALRAYELLRHHDGSEGWDATLPLLVPSAAPVRPYAPDHA